MPIRLIDSGWFEELISGCDANPGGVDIVCPFIKLESVRRLIGERRSMTIRVVTRFSLDDFRSGVSDITALRYLLHQGARIRGIKRLHAKVYLFGSRHAVVSSANLTEAGLTRNLEFGFASSDESEIDPISAYFERLWQRGQRDLQYSETEKWEAEIQESRRGLAEDPPPSLPDYGCDNGPPRPNVPAPGAGGAEFGHNVSAFLKFFGEGDNRLLLDDEILPIVEESGCHWACTYPVNRGRPRQPRDGDIMYLARLVEGDTVVFGRAIAISHDDIRDVATAADIELRPYKSRWPFYIRVHSPMFVRGSLADGVSVMSMIDELGAETFESTQRRARAGELGIRPRLAMRQQAGMKLTATAHEWLSQRFEASINRVGAIPDEDLNRLDWS